MVGITLYTRDPAPGAGLTTINLHRVAGRVSPLRIVTEEWKQDIPLFNAPLDGRVYEAGAPVAGKADLLLMVDGRGEVNLSRCEQGVAVVVTTGYETIVFWLADGRCTGIWIERGSADALARSIIEERCCREQILPPQIG